MTLFTERILTKLAEKKSTKKIKVKEFQLLNDIEDRLYYLLFLTKNNTFVVKFRDNKNSVVVSKPHQFSKQEIIAQTYTDADYFADSEFKMPMSQSDTISFVDKIIELFNNEKLEDFIEENGKTLFMIGNESVFLMETDSPTFKLMEEPKVTHKDFGESLIHPFVITKRKESSKQIKKIQELSKSLKSYVKGQDGLINDLMFYAFQVISYENQGVSNKPNLLITGPSGTGKTFTSKLFAKELSGAIGKKIKFIEFDMSRVTSSGFKGINMDVLLQRIKDSQKDGSSTLVFMDEIDTVFLKKESSSNDIMKELLKIIEATSLDLDTGKDNTSKDKGTVDLSKVYFIFAGAFHGKEFQNREDILNEFGHLTGIQEFLGRVSKVSATKKLDRESLISILKSPVGRLQNVLDNFNNQGVIFPSIDTLADSIADKADLSQFGARKLNELIDEFAHEVFQRNLNGEHEFSLLTVKKDSELIAI